MFSTLKRQPRIREDGTIEIVLTKGYVALIDPDDFWLSAFNWHVRFNSSGNVYAVGSFGLHLHREVLGLSKDDPRQVDHKNGDTMDCRRSNLRAVTCVENNRNTKMYCTNTSGVVGVRFDSKKNRWTADIGNRKIGKFKTREEAVAARISAELEEWGVHPRRAAALGVSSE